MDYRAAGVDIEAGYRSVELMKQYVKGTMRPEVLGGLGGFVAAILCALGAVKAGSAYSDLYNGGICAGIVILTAGLYWSNNRFDLCGKIG